MNLPGYTGVTTILGPPFSAVASSEFQFLLDSCFKRIVERGNTIATEKLPSYTRDFTDDQYAKG